MQGHANFAHARARPMHGSVVLSIRMDIKRCSYSCKVPTVSLIVTVLAGLRLRSHAAPVDHTQAPARSNAFAPFNRADVVQLSADSRSLD